MKRHSTKITINILFFAHLLIVMVRLGMFFVPTKLRPEKVSFHFRYITTILLSQFLWSLLLTKKAGMICPATTLMQYMRGYGLNNKNNYNHSFIAELCDILHIQVNFQTVNIILLATWIIAGIQYFYLM